MVWSSSGGATLNRRPIGIKSLAAIVKQVAQVDLAFGI
jgi:hypothetical protein